MIKRVALLVMIFVLTMSASALAAEPGSGVIDGSIVNRTSDGSSAADQEVTLKMYLNGGEENSTTARTDGEGYFIFENLSTEPGYSYEAVVNFQQAEYYSERLSFGEGESKKFAEVVVYDSTASDKAIKVMMSHTVMYPEEGGLRVKEYYLFVNDSDRTYIGSKEIADGGVKETLVFPLPEEATELQPALGLMDCCIYGNEGGFVDSMPVLPGSKEMVYSYRVNYNSGAYTYSRKVNYPTINYNLLMQGEGIKVASDQLTTGEPLDIEGALFTHLAGSDLARGDVLTAGLSGLPETTNQNMVRWVSVVLIVLIAGFISGYLLRKRRLQPLKAEDSLEQKRQKLLIEIAKLDDDFETGKIPEENYRRLRSVRKTQLIELMAEAKEESGKG